MSVRAPSSKGVSEGELFAEFLLSIGELLADVATVETDFHDIRHLCRNSRNGVRLSSADEANFARDRRS